MSDPRIGYRPEFFRDVADATHWYDERQAGLGQRFLDAVDRGRDSVRKAADSFTIIDGDIRLCPLRRFPYGIYFRSTPNELLFLGVLHLHRDSDAWRDRLAE